MPTSPADLVATEPDPLRRFCMVTVLADTRNGNLTSAWSAQRLADLRELLTRQPPVPQAEIARAADISPERVWALAQRALGGSRV